MKNPLFSEMSLEAYEFAVNLAEAVSDGYPYSLEQSMEICEDTIAFHGHFTFSERVAMGAISQHVLIEKLERCRGNLWK